MKFFKNLTISILFCFVLITSLPVTVSAGICPDLVERDICGPLNDPGKTKTNIISVKIENPLGAGGVSTVPQFIDKILDLAIQIALPILTLAIVYCGFLFVKAQGNPEELTKAKTALLYTLIGAAIILGAKVIESFVTDTVTELGATAMLIINHYMI